MKLSNVTKSSIFFLFIAVFCLLNVNIIAARGSDAATTESNQSTNANQGTTTENQNVTETQTQTQTNNPGVGAMTQEELQLRTQESIVGAAQTYSAKNSDSQDRSRQVAEAVKNMITLSYKIENQSLGTQIRNIAQTTNSYQDQANSAIDEAGTRTAFAKFFIGPNLNKLTEVKQVTVQNRLMIQQLNQIRAQISNAGQSTELENQIKTLESENTALEYELNQLESGFSLFGWLFKLIEKY